MSDRIEKRTVLKAPRSKVWQAVADSAQFGTWFGAAFEAPFVAGTRVRARITHPPEYAHLRFEVEVERVEPERLLSFRWVPGMEADAPATLVEISLADVEGGTEIRIVESGFDRIAEDRREEVRRGNDEGWAQQLENVRRHVEG